MAQPRGEEETDCPPTRTSIGRHGWTLLHAIALNFPDAPTPAEQKRVCEFLEAFGALYPCKACGKHWQAHLQKRKRLA